MTLASVHQPPDRFCYNTLMSAEREIFEPRELLRPGEPLRPFGAAQPLGPDQNFLEREFLLDGIGRGKAVFERTGEPDIGFYTAWLRRKGKEVLAPYGPVSVEYLIRPGRPPLPLTPCELDVCFCLPVTATPLPCVLELFSCSQSFLGVPSEPDEEIWPYRWVTENGQEVVLLFPNRSEVLSDVTIRFLKSRSVPAGFPPPQAHPLPPISGRAP